MYLRFQIRCVFIRPDNEMDILYQEIAVHEDTWEEDCNTEMKKISKKYIDANHTVKSITVKKIV